MPGYVLALSGAIGAGKSTLALKLAETLKIDRVSFGKAVREYAREMGQDPDDRAMLQKLGQALVMTDRVGFVERVLNQQPDQFPPHGDDRALIVDGVRHVEILLELTRRLHPRSVHLIHIVTPNQEREKRLKDQQIDRRLMARYDNDITEAQVMRILPQYAAFKVDGELPVGMQVAEVRRFITQQIGMPSVEQVPA